MWYVQFGHNLLTELVLTSVVGFDLVGAEDRPNHIGYYKDELLAFVNACKALNIDIPFMFHAGESLLDRGGSRNPQNSNLYDSLLLNAKRIGHGFSLVGHPDLAEQYRKKNVCIELCPTSNELLHLCRNVKEHPYPELLALGIPCCLNSDNPSLYRSVWPHIFRIGLYF
jgi:adenosine deaminase CECR1